MKQRRLRKGKNRPVSKVEYVVQDCPILGKKIVVHYLDNEKK